MLYVLFSVGMVGEMALTKIMIGAEGLLPEKTGPDRERLSLISKAPEDRSSGRVSYQSRRVSHARTRKRTPLPRDSFGMIH